MEAVRLLSGIDDHWKLMPEFFRRSRQFIERYLPETNPIPVIEDLKAKWWQTPYLTGYFLVFDDGKLPFAHMTSYVGDTYGKPYVFIYQAYCDKFSQLGEAASLVMKQVDDWAKILNMGLKQDAQITYFEMATFRKHEVWQRYFEKMNRTSIRVRSVIRGDLNVA